MKEIREYLDAMSEARSLADVNIAAGVALPVVSKIARRAVIVLALALLVTTAAFARGYTRLDHKLEQADKQHHVLLTRISNTTKARQQVMVAKIVEANAERDRLATEVGYLRSEVVPALEAAVHTEPAVAQGENAVVVKAPAAPSAASDPAPTLVEAEPPPPPPPPPPAPAPEPAPSPAPPSPPPPSPPPAVPPVGAQPPIGAQPPRPTPPVEPTPPTDPVEGPGAPAPGGLGAWPPVAGLTAP